MHVDEAGPATAPPLLLLHGGGVAGWMWRPTLAALRHPVRALVPDLPGHGRSATEPYRSHDDTVARLEALLEERAPGGAVVAGFSLGAQLAVLLAARRPELVADAVVVSAQAAPLPLAGPTLALLGLTAPLARVPWFARLQARELLVPEALLPEYVAGSAAITRATLLASVGRTCASRCRRAGAPQAARSWSSATGNAASCATRRGCCTTRIRAASCASSPARATGCRSSTPSAWRRCSTSGSRCSIGDGRMRRSPGRITRRIIPVDHPGG